METPSHFNKPANASNWSAGMGQEAVSPPDFYDLERQMGKTVEMISFGLKSGEKRAFVMSMFDEIKYQPEAGIKLFSRMAVVMIAGRNLQSLYQALTMRRVKEIREYSLEPVDESELQVEAIVIHSDYDSH